MSNIIEFKSSDQRNNEDIESGLRDALRLKGFSDSSIERAVSETLPLIIESKSLVTNPISFCLPESLEKDDADAISNEISTKLAVYQKGISNFVLKNIVSLACAIAENSEQNDI
jgi:hypothetical protein